MLGQVTFNGVIIRTKKEEKVDKKSKGGIILPDNADEESLKGIDIYKEHPNKGIVVQVGPNVTICKEGDCVYMTNMAGAPLIEGGVYYLHIREHDIAYVVPGEVWDNYLLETESVSTEIKS